VRKVPLTSGNAGRGNCHTVTIDDLATIDQHAHDAAERGADYVSVRRLAELIGAITLDAYAELGNLIASERPGRYAPSIYTAPLSRPALIDQGPGYARPRGACPRSAAGRAARMCRSRHRALDPCENESGTRQGAKHSGRFIQTESLW
jgi:hypothetical protein